MEKSILEEIFINGCLVEGNTIVEKDEGIDNSTGRYKKRLSFNPQKGEKVIFYEFEECNKLLEIFNIEKNKENEKLIDHIALYSNKKNRYLFLIELKGKNIRYAKEQLKYVIKKFKDNQNFSNSYNRLKEFIKAIIVHTNPLDMENSEVEGIDIIFLRNPARDRDIRKKLKL